MSLVRTEWFVSDHDAQARHSDSYAECIPLKQRKRSWLSVPASSILKWGFDICISLAAVLTLAPIFLAIAIAIKCTSSGPVFFSQDRYGLKCRRFKILKFRTMYVNRTDSSGVKQTVANDERFTPIGGFLRRFNLDELPQFINVIKGEMSLVGPRPHVPGMLAAGVKYEMLIDNYFDRLRAKPGLTGLAQALGFRGSTENAAMAAARIKMDLLYIENWSFTLDLLIIVKTIWYEIVHRGSGV